MFSDSWSGFVVAGMARRGVEMIHFRKNCAQFDAPISFAKSGKG